MKRVLIAIAVLAVTVMSSFAADVRSPDAGKAPMMKGTMHHGMKTAKMPQHLLMRAFHENLLNFGHALDKVAHQGEAAPRDFARIAIAEMRRSTDELEKYRIEALHNMSADVKAQHSEMQKMMDEHLVSMKVHLRELEILAKNDPIPSQDVIKHLHAIFDQFHGMDSNMTHREWMHHHGCGGMHGRMMHGDSGMQCPHCQGMMPQGMMPEHAKMMREYVQQMKAQDAEMTRLVAEMNQAPMDRKTGLLANIVSRMAEQHSLMTSHFEKMLQEHMPPQGASMQPLQMPAAR